ncbi:polyketide synthase dehydratase domain-containing protein, partial [Streptantibioticus silvisoli]
MCLPEGEWGRAGRFGLHPGLLDGALQAAAAGVVVGGSGDGSGGDGVGGFGGVGLPFSWSGVSLWASGASVLRVRLSPVGVGGFSVVAVDGEGVPVVSVERLAVRPVVAGQLERAGAAAGVGDVYRLEWMRFPVSGTVPELGAVALLGADLLGAGRGLAAAGVEVAPVGDRADLPGVVVLPVGAAASADGAVCPDGSVVRDAVVDVLDEVRRWVGDEGCGGSRLVVVTCGAVGDVVSDVAGAGVWGLVRSVQL